MAAAARVAQRRRRSQRRPEDERLRRPLKLLFIVGSAEYIRYFDSTMSLLLDRGHEVSIGVNRLRERKHARLEGIEDTRVRILGVIPKRLDLWTPMARAVRGTFDFVRYLQPRFADAPALRARMKRKVLPSWMAWLDRTRTLTERQLARVYRSLTRIENAIPISGRLTHFFSTHRPDVVVVSPLVDAASDQVDAVRAAQALGIPTVAAIASWDNLTNKGQLRVQPHMVTVWNEEQKREAVTLHGIEPDRIEVTGAQLFDRWFERRPSQSREDFCAMVGLPADRDIVLYTGSSVFISPSALEAPFARRWVQALRASGDPVVANASVLIRPHPFNVEGWQTMDFSDLGPVAVFPNARFTPSADTARTSFFDSLYYASAIVGVNTSAMVEAAILGKPVMSLMTGEFAATQQGTLHFHYLLPENGGFLRVARSLDEHISQLTGALRDPDLSRAETQSFVRAFLRPRGLDVPCTPLLADALERAGEMPCPPLRESVATRALRIALMPIAVLLRVAEFGGGNGLFSRKGLSEASRRLGRRTRGITRMVLVRPARGVMWVVRRIVAMYRRAVRRGVYWVLMTPRRVVRLFRHVRYHLAVRFRGDEQA
jgi:hypothetical protein